MSKPTFEDIKADFAFIDEWDERYRYLIDLGDHLDGLPEEMKSEENRVRGCASQVWLDMGFVDGRLKVRGDSDAAIVKGLVALMIALYAEKTPAEIMEIDTKSRLAELDLEDHITPQRANGLMSMVARIRQEAERALS